MDGRQIHIISVINEQPTEKVYTESQFKAMEELHLAKLNKVIEEKDRAQALVRSLTQEMAKKNMETARLDFFVTALTEGLKASSEAIKVLRGFGAQQNG